jgi:hypothetical protein
MYPWKDPASLLRTATVTMDFTSWLAFSRLLHSRAELRVACATYKKPRNLIEVLGSVATQYKAISSLSIFRAMVLSVGVSASSNS